MTYEIQSSPGYLESGGKLRLGSSSGYEFRQVFSWQGTEERRERIILLRAADVNSEAEYKVEAVQKVFEECIS